MNAINNLAASGAKGFVICTPDPNSALPSSRKRVATIWKVVAVDDRFAGKGAAKYNRSAGGDPGATKIGKRQGQELYKRIRETGLGISKKAR
ncbi:hypothetical protein ACNKHX_11795 [Shigella flexneri]